MVVGIGGGTGLKKGLCGRWFESGGEAPGAGDIFRVVGVQIHVRLPPGDGFVLHADLHHDVTNAGAVLGAV